MATIRRVATATVSSWPVRNPNVAAANAHQNVGSGVDTPNVATYNRANNIGQTARYSGFDFSAIPPGSTITSIDVRQLSQNHTEDPDDPGAFTPGTRFRIFAGAAKRHDASFNVFAEDPVIQAVTAGAVLTRDELAAGLLEVEKFTRRIAFAGEFPPVPTQA